MNEKALDIKKKIKKVLDKDRYQHTLGVAYTAANMAMRYGADMNDAFMAGLLHDCAKCIPNEEKFEMCKKYDIKLSKEETENPSLIHAKLGAFLAMKQYGITNMDIVNAVRTHTTGEPGMSLLQKIIFTADYIEPNRTEAPDLNTVRAMAYIDLDKTVCTILSDTLEYLRNKGAKIDPATEETQKYYKEITDKIKRG
ncbi:MAG: bis(5'-nucleosyl)-tetraphosphatase (symmetrical) YqeK [Lachnospiraceae bacterium]|nr:bis(5'-nucleosyl)-tetraphosphatase (symmetrical) YqeK [Lachnospiraceae bacterium]